MKANTVYHALIAAQNEEIVLVPHESFGNFTASISGGRNSNLTFVDHVLNGHVDAVLSKLYMTEERMKYFTYSNPFDSLQKICFYMHPKYAEVQLEVQENYWLTPYPSYVWAIFVILILYLFLIEFSRF